MPTARTSTEAKTASEASGHPFTHAHAMESPQRNQWNTAMEKECTWILLNNTFSAHNSQASRQLHVKLIVSKWVYKTKHNPDGSTQYKPRLVISGYEQMDFGMTKGPVGWLNMFRYHISLIRRYGWNLDLLDVVTAFLNPGINDDNIYMTLPEGWLDGLNAPKIIARLMEALYGLNQAPKLWHEDIIAFYSHLGSLNPWWILTSTFTVTAF